MAFKYKGLVKRSLLFLIVVSGHKSLCSVEEEQVQIFQNDYNETKKTLGEYCWREECSEKQICNEIFKCECCPGFINRSNVCVPCSEENEECLTSHNCCGMLFCINGTCRKTTPDADFITLAKVCLGITIISIIIALLSCSLKCLLRLNNSQMCSRCRNSQGSNSTVTQVRRVLESQTLPNRAQEEKPPSYEECVRQGQRSPLADPPPAYMISSNYFTINSRNCVFPVKNITEITSPNNLTLLNTQVLPQEQFSNE